MGYINRNTNLSNGSFDYLTNINPLLGKEAKDIAVIVNCIVLCGSIAFIGIVTNIINLIVFSKQGYENTMNICLSGIAVSDMCTLIAMIWYDICISPLWENSDTNVLFSEVLYLTAGWPNVIFARITCIVTVFITIERYLCVVMPLKVKNIITRTKTILIVILIFLSQMLTTVPSYYSTYIDWKFVPSKNRSMLGLLHIPRWEQMENLSFVLQATMQAGSFTMLIFFTVLLIVSIKQKSQWRKTATSETQKDNITIKDRKLVRMVVLIAMILILCFTPGMICFTAMAFEPGLIVGGVYDSVFFVIGSFMFIFQTLNSSVNMFVYYTMSSNFRITFLETFPKFSNIFS